MHVCNDSKWLLYVPAVLLYGWKLLLDWNGSIINEASVSNYIWFLCDNAPDASKPMCVVSVVARKQFEIWASTYHAYLENLVIVTRVGLNSSCLVFRTNFSQ